MNNVRIDSISPKGQSPSENEASTCAQNRIHGWG